jgi:hypothetical protein
MRERVRTLLILLALSVATATSGCKKEIPDDLLGTWTSVEELEDGSKWSLTYIIGPQRYWVSGDPPTVEGGLVGFDEQDCRRYHMIFTERVANGELAPDINVWVELSHDGAELRWQDHLYRRVSRIQEPGEDYQYDPS